MSKSGNPLADIVLHAAYEVGRVTFIEYKQTMAHLYESTGGAYGYPFEVKKLERDAGVLEPASAKPTRTPKVKRSPGRAPIMPSAADRPRQVPEGRSRRPRAAKNDTKGKRRRTRWGWNNHFSIMPLDAHRRPYRRWPRI